MLAGLLLLLSTPLLAQNVRITLLDGSVVIGEIQALKDGVYHVRSGSLGNMTVKQTDIRRIEMTAESAPRAGASKSPPREPKEVADEAPADTGNAVAKHQIEGIQRQIAENDALMGAVAGLQDDPEVQAILADPAIMDAMRKGDIGAMVNNPKLRALLDNPAVQDLTKRLTP